MLSCHENFRGKEYLWLPSPGPLARAGLLCGIGGFWLPPYPKRRRYECVARGTGIPRLCPRRITCYIRLNHGAILTHLYGCVNTFWTKNRELFLNFSAAARIKQQTAAFCRLSRNLYKKFTVPGKISKDICGMECYNIPCDFTQMHLGQSGPFNLREGCVQ